MLSLAMQTIEGVALNDTVEMVNSAGGVFWLRTMTVKYKSGEQSISLFSSVSADALEISAPDPVRDGLVAVLSALLDQVDNACSTSLPVTAFKGARDAARAALATAGAT